MKENNKYNILVVDDQDIVREGIINIIELSDRGHAIYEANDGLKAINMSKNMKFDIILMDLNMPVMDGFEASKTLLESNKEIKILIVSMLSDKYVVERLKNMGVSGFIYKDEVSSDILNKIDDIVLSNYKIFPKN